MLDLYEELTFITAALEQRSIDYALCGGLAMAVYSVPRATIDIDLLVLPEDVARVYEAVEPLGYRFKAQPMTFAGGAIDIRRVTKMDAEGDTLMLDLLLVTNATKQVWANRRRVELRDRTISVVSREGLVALKSFRMSGRDVDDIAALRNAE